MNTIFKGIKTNNLKNINYTLNKNRINVIVGTSGSGKSSLAFDTIGNLCQDEFKKLYGDFNTKSNYDISNYNRLLVSVSLKQLNYNKNPRSTIGSYYGLDTDLKKVFAHKFNLNIKDISFNKYESMCKKCSGLGYIVIPDKYKVIDFNKAIKDNPFIPWNNTFKDYYNQIITKVIKDRQINGNYMFNELKDEDKDFLLYGLGEKKYKINYNQSGRNRVKTDSFQGVIKYLEKEFLENNSNSMENYGLETVCPECNGGRLNKKLNKYKIDGLTLADLLTMDFIELYKFFVKQEEKGNMKVDKRNIKNIIDMKLGYLNLNRSISSLSGGELQRLQLSRILNSTFTDLLIILDEPLSNIHISEQDDILNKMVSLKNKNTLIVVEHNEKILEYSDEILALGPDGGIKGGNIIDKEEYLDKQAFYKSKVLEINKKGTISDDCDTFKIVNNAKINNLEEFSIEIPKNKLIGVSGASGSGKSTLLNKVIPQNITRYKYISQKPIMGNTYSTVATYLDVLSDIRKLYSKENNVDQRLFSYHFSGLGKCKVCNGTGEISLDSYNLSDMSGVCPECEGKRYNKNALSYKYKNLNIFEFLNKTIEEIILFLDDKESKLTQKLILAEELSLGHLKLIQEIKTLSGGENQRIKILGNLNINTRNQVIGLDEPFKGLDNKNIYKLLLFFYKLIDLKDWTIIFVEHEILALNSCQYLIDIGPFGGELGGKIMFCGSIEDAKANNSVSISEYLI